VGHVVRIAQPQRGLIPTLFDEAAVAPEPILVATRLADRRATVVVGDQDSGVPNRSLPGGCTVDDLILDEAAGWPSRDVFVSDIQTVLDEFAAAGLISGKERAAITRAAIRSGIGA
jgi:hypothetical protein